MNFDVEAQELTERWETVSREENGEPVQGIRLFLEPPLASACPLHHKPEDRFTPTITFWDLSQVRGVLQAGLAAIEKAMAKPSKPSAADRTIPIPFEQAAIARGEGELQPLTLDTLNGLTPDALNGLNPTLQGTAEGVAILAALQEKVGRPVNPETTPVPRPMPADPVELNFLLNQAMDDKILLPGDWDSVEEAWRRLAAREREPWFQEAQKQLTIAKKQQLPSLHHPAHPKMAVRRWSETQRDVINLCLVQVTDLPADDWNPYADLSEVLQTHVVSRVLRKRSLCGLLPKFWTDTSSDMLKRHGRCSECARILNTAIVETFVPRPTEPVETTPAFRVGFRGMWLQVDGSDPKGERVGWTALGTTGTRFPTLKEARVYAERFSANIENDDGEVVETFVLRPPTAEVMVSNTPPASTTVAGEKKKPGRPPGSKNKKNGESHGLRRRQAGAVITITKQVLGPPLEEDLVPEPAPVTSGWDLCAMIADREEEGT